MRDRKASYAAVLLKGGPAEQQVVPYIAHNKIPHERYEVGDHALYLVNHCNSPSSQNLCRNGENPMRANILSPREQRNRQIDKR